MKKIGFLINPIAGMGGAVGLKGTDGKLDEATTRGAVPQAKNRAKITLDALKKNTKDLIFLTPSGEMGEDALKEVSPGHVQVISYPGKDSTARDTKTAAQRFLEEGVDLILFCGGDGTARDIFDIVGRNVPILGIPAGVKMYSGVFAVNPRAAADIVASEIWSFRDSEVMDVDEDAYRGGELRTRLYGIARVPSLAGRTQFSKQTYEDSDEERVKKDIARFIREIMMPDVLYILGAGTTTETIARETGVKKTLLGVDAIKNGRLVGSDLDEKTLWMLIEQGQEAKILVSPIGAQGFILGRGNQQISPRIVDRVGIRNLIVVATPHKLRETPMLYVDSGNPELDKKFGDSVQVISGYRMAQRRKIFQMQ